MAIAAGGGKQLQQVDIKTAFLQTANLPENKQFLIRIPNKTPEYILEKFQWKKNQILRAVKPLYGSKEAPRAWYDDLSKHLKEGCRLRPNVKEPCIFMGELAEMLLVHVDDIVIQTANAERNEFRKKQISDKYEMKDLGEPRKILGYECYVTNPGIVLMQKTYIENLAEKYGVTNARIPRTPMNPTIKLSEEYGPEDEETKEQMRKLPYRELVGALMYVASRTRPDISFAVNYLGRQGSNPGPMHWKMALTVLKYLNGTKEYGIFYPRVREMEGIVEGWSDADWAENDSKRRSTTGYVFTLNGTAVAWMSKIQSRVAQSTMEAELYALKEACNESLFLRFVLEDMGYPQGTIKIGVDNQSTIAVANNPSALHGKSKQIDANHTKLMINEKEVAIYYVKSEDNPADIFTKPLTRDAFEKCRKQLGVRLITEELKGVK